MNIHDFGPYVSEAVEAPKAASTTSQNNCPICWNEVGKTNVAISPCGHTFCLTCLIDWQRRSNSCPVCRTRLMPEGDDISADAANEADAADAADAAFTQIPIPYINFLGITPYNILFSPTTIRGQFDQGRQIRLGGYIQGLLGDPEAELLDDIYQPI